MLVNFLFRVKILERLNTICIFAIKRKRARTDAFMPSDGQIILKLVYLSTLAHFMHIYRLKLGRYNIALQAFYQYSGGYYSVVPEKNMKIQQKLFLIQCGFSFALVTTLALLMQWSINNGMVDYVNTKEIEALSPVVKSLAQAYEKESSWLFIANKQGRFRDLILEQLMGSEFIPPRHKKVGRPNGPGRRPPPEKYRSAHKPLAPLPSGDEVHYALLDQNHRYVVGNYTQALEYNVTPIILNKAVVGYFAVSKRSRLTEGYELDFIEQQQSYLWVIALVLMLFVILITFPLARHIVEPIKVIAWGMNKLNKGEYKQQISVTRKDEIGELSRDYNELALTLAENENARKRWLANISHELRTPIAISSVELEAMLDDIRPMTKENISSARDELKHLETLIDDLHQLTIADIGGMRYCKENENITQLIQAEQSKYQGYLADAGITLVLNILNQPLYIYGDKTRLVQLFENIINNTIKYSQATQLKMSLTVDKSNNTPSLLLTFEDNGVGVDPKHLANLFEYLYRPDDSRNRKTGGAGLGLSICQHIVIAHQGEITAEQASLGGLAIKIRLPLA